MSKSKKCLMVGLPNAGKTSYLAAFWAIEKNGDSGHKISFSSYPEKTVHLDKIKNEWLEQASVDRTPTDFIDEIRLPLIANRTEKFTLEMPDFKGENYSRILLNNPSTNITKWITDADCTMFFIEMNYEDSLSDDLGDTKNTNDNKIETMKLSDISPWTQNIMLLKYLSECINANKPIAICFSAWDKIENQIEGMSVDDWVSSKHRFLKNFVEHKFTNVKYYGISAQGRNYDKGGEVETTKFEELTRAKKRAYVYTNQKNYDITLPLDFLISQN